MIRALAGVVLIGIASACSTTQSPPSASPVVAAGPTRTPTASPVATTPAPTQPATQYADPILGYSTTLPPAWRVSECLSGVTREGSHLGQDVFTTRTAAEEHDLGAGGDTGGTGAVTWTITIAAMTSSLSAMEYATASGGSIGQKLEPTTIDGKPAVRRVDGVGTAQTYYVANAGRMYTIGLSPGFEARPALVTDTALDVVARSMSFMTPAARPTPTPAPPLSPAVEAVVDAVAAAFAASDADKLRELMPPTCWFASAGYRSSGVLLSREKMADLLRGSFTHGRTVTVEARPIKSDPPYLKGPFWVWSTWSAYNSPSFSPESVTQLVFDQIDGRWYWSGALFNAGELKRP